MLASVSNKGYTVQCFSFNNYIIKPSANYFMVLPGGPGPTAATRHAPTRRATGTKKPPGHAAGGLATKAGGRLAQALDGGAQALPYLARA